VNVSILPYLCPSLKHIKLPDLRKVIVFGLLIRIILAPISIGLNDGYYWYILFIDILTGENPYVRRDIVYPPSWYYTLTPFAYIYAYFARILDLNPIPIEKLPFPLYMLMLTRWGPSAIIDPLSATLIKIPLILSDFGTTLVIFHLIKELTGDDKKACTGASLWFLNPYVIVISSVWGQIDTLSLFFLVVATYYLNKKQFFRSGFYSGICISYKIIMGIFIYALLISIIFSTSSSFKQLGRSLLAFITPLITIFIILSAPFLISNSNEYVSGVLWPLSYSASFSFPSFIYISLKFILSNEQIARIAVIIGFIIFSLLVNFLIYKDENNSIIWFNNSLLYTLLAFYAFSYSTNDRYLVFALPYLIINNVSSFGKSRKILHVYWSIPFIFIILTQALTIFMPLFAFINDYRIAQFISLFQQNYDSFVLRSVLMSQFLTVLQIIPSLICFILIVKLIRRYLGNGK
jgi:hypothetical protein